MTPEAYADRVKADYQNRTHFHCMNLDGGLVIDGGTFGGEARFINHSCDPNCHIEKWNVLGQWRIGIFATRDIHLDEELSYDYNFQSFGETKRCFCGSNNCRGLMGAKDEKVDRGDKVVETKGKQTKAKRGRKRKQKVVKEEGQVLLEEMQKPVGPRMRKLVQQRRLLLIRNIMKVRAGVLGAEPNDTKDKEDTELTATTEPEDEMITADDAQANLIKLISGPALDAFKTKLLSLKAGGRAPRTRTLAVADNDVDVDRCAQMVHILLGTSYCPCISC